MNRNLYTIGHSNHSLLQFLDLLQKHKVSAVCDVRSTPYSRLHPHFNRETLHQELKIREIAYVFLGNELGGRTSDTSCCDDEGKLRYDLIADTDAFRRGLERVRKGIKNYRVVLMCAEKDPLTCHRTILVCRHLRGERELSIVHILEDGRTESHEESEKRLLRIASMEQGDLFKTFQEQLEEAYDQQGRRIAYRVRSREKGLEGLADSEFRA